MSYVGSSPNPSPAPSKSAVRGIDFKFPESDPPVPGQSVHHLSPHVDPPPPPFHVVPPGGGSLRAVRRSTTTRGRSNQAQSLQFGEFADQSIADAAFGGDAGRVDGAQDGGQTVQAEGAGDGGFGIEYHGGGGGFWFRRRRRRRRGAAGGGLELGQLAFADLARSGRGGET